MNAKTTAKTEVKKEISTWLLFAGFFRIGAITIGGGYAMIPIIERDLVRHRRWLGEEEFLDLIAAAQTVPGVIAVNTAGLVGHRLAGIRGALAAIAGAALPSFLIILLVAAFLGRYWHNAYISKFLAGARPAVAGLLLYAAVTLGAKPLASFSGLVLFSIGLVSLVLLNAPPILVLIVGAISGLWFSKEG